METEMEMVMAVRHPEKVALLVVQLVSVELRGREKVRELLGQ
jgi:hypothetical protein